jgi:hypothetical protein
VDIEEDHGRILIEKIPERFGAGSDLYEIAIRRPQDRFQRQKVSRIVINQKDVDSLFLNLHQTSRSISYATYAASMILGFPAGDTS